ncbi:hypothetical protein EI94DRAFT_1804637 [Lactarius quietus]|nr:hypothetical protein EI94DRAFT_1804637 [Lactarius quietus]
MSAHVPITDLTVDEFGDVNLWIGQGKRYHDVPAYVSEELCCHTSALPTATSLLPSSLFPVTHLLNFCTPPITPSLQGCDAEAIFSHNRALRACAGQAMLDRKISLQHWERDDIFSPFDALGTWALIVEADTAKNAWRDALRWLDQQHKVSIQYIAQITKLLGTVPWKDYIKGLGSGLSVTDMAVFLSQEWLSDAHLDSMLNATIYLRRGTLSHIIPRTEIILSDFTTHILASKLLDVSPVPCDYVKKAPKSVLRLSSVISESSSNLRLAMVSFLPPGHWACLIIDFQAGTIGWGDSARRAAPARLEKCLRAWLQLFSPQVQFLAPQALLLRFAQPASKQRRCLHEHWKNCHDYPEAHTWESRAEEDIKEEAAIRTLVQAEDDRYLAYDETDGYSCGIITVNTLKHNVFGDKLWDESCQESLWIAEFLNILETSDSHRPKANLADPITHTTPPPPAIPRLSSSLQGPPGVDTLSNSMAALPTPPAAPQVQCNVSTER